MAGERAGTALGCALIDEQRLHDGGFHTAHVHSDNLRASGFIEGQELNSTLAPVPAISGMMKKALFLNKHERLLSATCGKAC